MGMRRWTDLALPALAFLLVLGGFPAAWPQEGTSSQPPESPGKPQRIGAEECGACHEQEATNFRKNPHGKTGVANWDGATQCETCHGSGAEHAVEGDKTKIRNLKLLSPTESAAVCLSCHGRGDRSHWSGSPHEGRGLSCLNCHKIHHVGTPPPRLFAKGTEF